MRRPRSTARLALLLAAAAPLPACLWLPNFPPDHGEPPTEGPQDDRLVSHCSPHASPTRPVLVSAEEGPRRFQCRIRGADEVLWTFDPLGDPGILPFALGTGVQDVDLHREDLPWSPRPYEAELEVRARAGGTEITVTWPLVVVPSAGELFEPPTPAAAEPAP
jgi:hypothetical protein